MVSKLNKSSFSVIDSVGMEQGSFARGVEVRVAVKNFFVLLYGGKLLTVLRQTSLLCDGNYYRYLYSTCCVCTNKRISQSS